MSLQINFRPNPLHLKELSLYLHCQIITKDKSFPYESRLEAHNILLGFFYAAETVFDCRGT